MLTTDLKAKEAIYEVVEPSYFQNAESLSSEDGQGAIYDFLKEIGTEEYIDWLSSHENDYYFEVVRGWSCIRIWRRRTRRPRQRRISKLV